MRTVNFRLIGIILLGTALVGVVASLVHGVQVRRNAEVLLREAKNAKERKDWNEAIDFLDRYVALVPKDNAGPLSELGLLQADNRRLWEAYQTLENVLRQDPLNTKVRRRLVEVDLTLGRFPDARHHADLLLNASPENVELLVLKAQALAGMAEYDAAVESYEKAIAIAPDNLDNHARLAVLLHGPMKAPARALAALDSMVELNPEVSRAYVIRGAHRLEHRRETLRAAEKPPATGGASSDKTTPEGEEPKKGSKPEPIASAGDKAEDAEAVALASALADARRALELAPDDQAAIAFGVRCLLANGKQDEAGKLARRGLELHPKVAAMYASLAEIELNAGHRDKAIAWYEKGLAAVPNERDLLWNLSNALIDAAEINDAEQHLVTLRAIGYPKPAIAYLEARIQVQKQDWFEAGRQLEGLRAALTEFPDLSKQADFLLGQCYEQLGRTDLQLTAYRRASGADSRWVPARLGVAAALLATGHIDEALSEYRQIALLPQAPASVLAQLARLMILVNLRRTQKEQNWDNPEQLLKRLAEIDPEAPVIPVLRAEIKLAQGKNKEAEELLEEARDNSPKTFDFWLGLAIVADRRDDTARAAEILEEARAVVGDTVPLRLARARIAARQRGDEAKHALREFARGGDDLAKDDQIALYAGLAVLTLAVGDYEETERLCTLVAAEQPANLRVRLLMFDLAFRAGSTESMEKVLDEVQRIEHDGPLWHYGEAVRLCVLAKAEKQPGRYTKAKEHLTEARIARPGWSRVPQLVGQINDIQEDEEGAISNFIQAINLGERDMRVISRAVGLLYQRGRFPEADHIIRHLQEQQSPFSSELTRLATDISMQLNDSERALSLVTRAAEKSKDPADHVWAGRVLSALGRYDEAEKNFLQAIEIDESAPAAWVALIQHYGRTLQSQKADDALSKAGQKIEPAEAPLALAEALESIGRIDDAEARYKSALEAAPAEISVVRRVAEFYMRQRKFAEAEPLLTRLLDDEAGVTGADRLHCRRNLAVALLAHNEPAFRKKAQELIAENLAIDPKSAPDLRAQAMILATSPERASRREATQLLEQTLVDRQAEGSAETRFVLASLYIDLGDVGKAASHLRTLVATPNEVPRYLTSYIRFLLTQNQVDEAELWLSRLELRFSKEINTLALATDVAFAGKRYDAILPAADQFLAKIEGTEAERHERKRLVASLLETNAERLKSLAVQKSEKAELAAEWAPQLLARTEELYRSNAEELPADALAKAAFYGRVGRHAESLDLLEQSWSDAKPEEIAAVTATLMKSPAANNEHYARATRVVEAALQKRDRPLVLVLDLANLQNWRGNFSSAEELYREALRKDPKNAGTLNNLALLLALRGRGGQEPLTMIQKALEIAGPHPGLLDSRATIYLALGDPRHAAEDLTKAIMRRPSPGSYFRQAQVELRLGNKNAARDSFAKAGELGLKAEELHPLERPIYKQLQAELQ
jgi:tetratricopeptide (TPR) repeat protein